jgi:hypothetical protein
MTTSYFSSVSSDSKVGVRRGKGGAKEGRTRRSREDVEYSVKTGIFLHVGIELLRVERKEI